MLQLHGQVFATWATVMQEKNKRAQNKQSTALQLLTPIYNWFTEVFDTYDLQSTKTLLDELAQETP